MIDDFYQAAKPLLFRRDPEDVHEKVMAALGKASARPELLDRFSFAPDPRLAVRIFGLELSHPLGIAAGLDKNGIAFPALLALGFGHVEIGTMTPRPQDGNPRPRVFRLVEDRALINRMGFPGEGVAEVIAHAAARKRNAMVVGCNIGPNKSAVESGRATDDLVACYRAVASLATWVIVNVSSPNTPGLRNLQHRAALREMLQTLNEERRTFHWRPILIKISPNLAPDDLDALIDVAVDMNIDALVATNTTISRPSRLHSPNQIESGGLSGPPLASIAAATVRRISERTKGSMPIIAAGGIQTGLDVVHAIDAGATLCQTYTGFIYRGPAMPTLMSAEIVTELDRRGLQSLKELIESRDSS